MESAIASVTEEHLIVIPGLVTLTAHLAIGTIPLIFSSLPNDDRIGKLNAGRMLTDAAIGTVEHESRGDGRLFVFWNFDFGTVNTFSLTESILM